MNRAERRRLAREQGHQAVWEPMPLARDYGLGKGGWLGQMDRHYVNGKYSVQVRTVQTPWGDVEHAVIRNTGGTDIPWAEKQQIKNELFGPERVAIEVFPAESELIDAANMYHIWVLPAGTKLPFGLDGDLPRARHPGGEGR